MCESTPNIKIVTATVVIIFECTFVQHYCVVWPGVW